VKSLAPFWVAKRVVISAGGHICRFLPRNVGNQRLSDVTWLLKAVYIRPDVLAEPGDGGSGERKTCGDMPAWCCVDHQADRLLTDYRTHIEWPGRSLVTNRGNRWKLTAFGCPTAPLSRERST
jgi:hypothetical protein